MNTAIIGIGSNIDPENNIPLALKLLGRQVSVEKISEMIRTSPIGITDQPDFINGAIRIATNLSKLELEQRLKITEEQIGRVRSLPKFGPRTIDLDLVVWNDKIESTPRSGFLKLVFKQS